MTSFNIAFGNFKRNLKTYTLYVASLIFSVIVYYNFVELKYNPDFQKANQATYYIKTTSNMVAVLLLLFIVFFIWYSSSFFQKQRKNEIGLYAFMGVSNSKIAAIYSFEVLFIGSLSIIIGLFLGIAFCKLFLMMLAKVALLNMQIRFFISVKAVIETVLTFLAIFIAVSLIGYINIIKSKLIDLFNASKIEQQAPKVNYVTGILSIFLIGAGYYFALHAAKGQFNNYIPLALIFVIAGTYLLFGSAYSIVMKILINNKKILYKKVNIISFSNIAFRIKNNYRTLSVVAILVAIILTAYGTVYSLKYYIAERDKISTPYTISYISKGENMDKQVKDMIKNHDLQIVTHEKINFLIMPADIKNSEFNNGKEENNAIFKYSDFIKVSQDLKVERLNNIKNIKLSKGETIQIDIPTVVLSIINNKNKSAVIDKNEYFIKDSLKTPVFGVQLPCASYVLNDQDYDSLKKNHAEYEFDGMNINNNSNVKVLKNDLLKINGLQNNLFVNEGTDKSSYSIFGIIYFLGAFLAIVFVAATGSIIYFKLISEAYNDKNKYAILKRLGMTKNEAYRSVASQIGISYILPLLIGIIHSCVAMSVLSSLMNYNIIIPTVTSIIIFSAVYFIYFIASSRKYINIVY